MKRKYLYVMVSLTSLVIIQSAVTSAHEGHVHAQNEGDTRSSTKVEINTSEDKSNVRLRIENRLKSTNQIKEQKQVAQQERKASFEEKLAQIKDEKKRALAARLSNQINKINDIRTERYLKNLERLSRILEKIENRAEELKESGKPVDNFLASIASIKSSIESTTAKVEAQQEKTYTVEIQSESTLGADFRKVHAELKSDLSLLTGEIKAIKDNMNSLFRDLKAVSASSPSPSSTPE